MANPTRNLMSIREVCAYLGVSRGHLYRLKRDPAFPRPFDLGDKSPRFRPEQLDAWLASRQAPRPEAA